MGTYNEAETQNYKSRKPRTVDFVLGVGSHFPVRAHGQLLPKHTTLSTTKTTYFFPSLSLSLGPPRT